MQRKYGQKYLCADDGEHPEWDVRVFDAQEDVPPVLNSYLANGMSIFSKSRNPERALMALDYLRNDAEINNLFCYGIEGKALGGLGRARPGVSSGQHELRL